MPRRVLLDGTKLLDRRTDGVKRYVEELVRSLAEARPAQIHIDVALTAEHVAPLSAVAEKLDAGNLLHEFVPRLLLHGDDNPLHVCQRRVRSGASEGWSRARDIAQLQALKLARSGLRRWSSVANTLNKRTYDYDVIHLSLPNTWRQLAGFSGRRLTVVHDLSHLVCPELQTPENNHSLAQGLADAGRAGSRFLAVSHSTAHELTARLHVPSSQIDVVHQGVDHRRFTPHHPPDARRRVQRRYNLSGGRFLLSLGTIEPRKNLLNVVRGFLEFAQRHQDDPLRLVIGGYRGWGDHSELDELIAGSSCVQAVGYLQEEDLPVLYSMCEAFCYVSRYEGFGLPLLEAMSCGAPVVYGDNSSLPEVAGSGGVGAPANDPSAIAAAIEQVVGHPGRRTELAVAALRQASRFDWRRTALQTLAAYDRLLSEPQRDLAAREVTRARIA